MSKYQIFEPGKYLEWEKKIVEERMAIASKTPPKKRSAPSAPLSEYEICHFNHIWDPFNPLFNDKKYAKKAGYKDIFAWPGIKAPMEGIMAVAVPHNMTDISHIRHGPNDIEFIAPIYPGDTFTTDVEKYYFEDITKPGSDLRILQNGVTMRMYNQKDEMVARSSVWRAEAYKKIIDGSEISPSEFANQIPPAHYTTDEEWEYIKELWSKEQIRGSKPLYWEDVKVGDEPPWICSGPITYMDMVRWYGNMVEDCKQARDMICSGGAAHAFKDRFGDYLIGVSGMYGNQNIPESRAMCFNDTCAKLITRMVTNYIGDTGFVTRIGWMFQQTYAGTRKEREGGEYLDQVPYMKGKGCTTHPTTGDTCIAKGYVTKKYINTKGEHIIDLVCWGESLDKRILEVVPAAARLPSKSKK